MNEYRCKRIAREYFWPELGGKNKPGWVLHHKDPSWRKNDPERYAKWNPEDLIPMTRAEHQKWHIENDPEWMKNVVNALIGENNPFFGKHHSKESKMKMRDAKLGKHHSEETKNKISEAHIGKHHSKDTKKKMSEARSGEKNPFFGTHYYNNGHVNIRAKECPQGFIKGRLI